MLITWGSRTSFIDEVFTSCYLLLSSASDDQLTKTMILFSLLCVKD